MHTGYGQAPVITSFAPTAAGHGSVITITGTDLSNVTSVRIGSAGESSFTVLSSTTIIASVQMVNAGSGDITVTSLAGSGAISGFIFINENEIELSALEISGSLSPAYFTPFSTEYSVNVSYATAAATLTPTLNTLNAPATVITVNGIIVTSGTLSPQIPLNIGLNTILINVSAYGGAAMKTYTVSVNRQDVNDAKLSGLGISYGSLSPEFHPAVTGYSVAVSGTTESVSISATAVYPTATITINGITTTSGVQSAPISLVVGSNHIPVIVSFPNGVSRTYTLTVIRPGVAAPVIGSVFPLSGPVGTLVTITGGDMADLTGFTIGGVPAILVSGTATSVVGMVMPGAVTGLISLTTSMGTSSSAVNFEVKPALYPATQQGNKLMGTNTVGAAHQGRSVAISADGNTAIVGGYTDNSNTGAAWIYTRNNGIWTQQGNKLVGAASVGEAYQGYAVSISADGNTAIIGGYRDDADKGAAWVFVRDNGNWVQQGNKLVGTGSLFFSRQGWSVALSADGNTAAVGSINSDGARGAVWVFIRTNGVWTQQGERLTDAGAAEQAYMGNSLDLSADGNTLIAGGFGDNSNIGAAWIFKRNNGTWTQQGNKLVGSGNVGMSYQGMSVSISADGKTVAIGGYSDNNIGATWVFTFDGNNWTQQGNKLVGSGYFGPALQGSSVSLNADGNILLVGGYMDNSKGANWLFKRSNGSWQQVGNKITGTGTIGMAHQAFSLAVSADGSTAISGGPEDNSGQGAAWIFGISNNALLSALSISAGVLSPVFSGTTNGYSVTVTDAVSSITLTPTTADATALVTINGISVTSGTASAPISLTPGVNYIQIVVTAQDGVTNAYYTVGVTQTVLAVPVVSSLSPASGPAGTSVIISGNHFDPVPANNIVYFGATRATVTSAGISSVTVTVPYGATAQPVSVLNFSNGLTGYSSSPFRVTFPTKNSISAQDLAAKVDFSTAISNNTVAVLGDIDGDGKADLVTGGQSSTFSIFRNTASSGVISTTSFAPRVDFTNSGGISIALADVDGDGKLDVITANGINVSVFRNIATAGSISNGSFAARVDFALPSAASYLSIADFNKDGKPDIAAFRSSLSPVVSILQNTGGQGNITSSSFSIRVDLPLNANSTGMAVDDFDGDGKQDIAVANPMGSAVSLIRNISGTTASFEPRVELTTSAPVGIATGDIDGDGKTDIVCNGPGLNFFILRNTATAGSFTTTSFSPKVDIVTGTGVPRVGMADMDGDGKPDILCLRSGSSTTVSCFRNKSTPGAITAASFDPRVDFAAGVAVSGFTTGDIDGDGKPDLVSPNNGPATISVARNNPPPPPVISSFAPASAVIGTTVNITGNGFNNVSAVSFGGVAAASFTVFSPTSIAAVVGNGGASGEVSITALAGSAALSGFTFIPPPAPVISSFTPDSGAVGKIVTITGSNLNNLISIQIGGKAAIPVSNSGSIVKAMVMPGAVTGGISLVTAGGSASVTGNFTVTTTGYPNVQQGNKVTGNDVVGNSQQGQSVAISADGNTAVAGGPFDGSNKGAVWIYTRTDSTWIQQGGKLVGADSVGNPQQGWSVAISADGNTVASGAPSDNGLRGAVWVFTRNGNTWTQQGSKLVATGNTGNAALGYSISISADGNTVLAGGFQDSLSRGATWVFTRNGSSWTQQAKLVGIGGAAGSNQGAASALSADGNTAAVGGRAYNGFQGAVWIFARNGSVWTQQAQLIGSGSASGSFNGFAVAISADGNTVISGGRSDNVSQGASWIFVRNGTTWTQQGAKLVGTGNTGAAQQGYSVAISADGNTALSGGRADNGTMGATWLFTRSGNVWSQRGTKIVPIGNTGTAGHSIGMAITADATASIIGGASDNAGKGAAWIYRHAKQPVITSFSPTFGTTGFFINITGSDFAEVMSVKFGGVAAMSFTVTSSSAITAIVGAGASGNVEVTTPLGTATAGGFSFYPPVTGAISGSDTVCQNAAQPLISFTATGGLAPYTFTYNVNGGSSQTVRAENSDPVYLPVPTLTSGTFKYKLLFVSSAVGAKSTPDSATVLVTPVTPASVTPSGPLTFCAGGSAILTASPGTSYLWTTGETTQSATITQTGDYQVTVYNADGCASTSAMISVTASPIPEPTINASGPLTFCAGGSVVLTASPGTTYLWTTGETTQSATITHTGDYQVTVTNANGCSSTSAIISVTVGALPEPAISVSGPLTFCAGGSVVLTASPGTSYLWSTGESTQSVTISQTGDYQVTVTNADGCASTSAMISVTVSVLPEPTISASGPLTFCAGGSVVLTASPGTSYLWSTGETTQSVTLSQTGNYQVTVTNANGCTSTSAMISVTVSALPEATITPSGPTAICVGGSVVLTASAGTYYSWSTGENTQAITVTQAGNYQVTVGNAEGCMSASAPVTITVNPIPVVNIIASGPLSFCAGGSVELSAGTGDTWLWSNGATTPSIMVTQSGTYSVTVTNTGGCLANADPVEVTVEASPAATITPSTTTTCYVRLNANTGAGLSYQWKFNGAPISGATATYYNARSDGDYTVTVTQNGCTNASAAYSALVNDSIAPVAKAKNITVSLSATTGTVTITTAAINNASTDNCTIASITLDRTGFSCNDVGDNTVTLTVTDAAGNTDTATAIVTVQDITKPVARTRSVIAKLDASGAASITAAQVDNGSTDNCSIASVTVSPSSFTCANLGANTVTLTVTDINGNVSTKTATVTVQDTIVPVVIIKNITVQLSPAGTVTIAGSQLDDGSTDNCGIATITVSPSVFTCSKVGANTVTVTVKDTKGNTSTDTAVVTVEDTVLPVAVTKNITVNLNASGTATITPAQVNNASSDNCGTVTLSLSKTVFDCSDIGANTVTLTVTDKNGNTDSATATVTVQDIAKPVIITKTATVQLNASGTVQITTADINNGSTDNCGIASITVFPDLFTCANIGANMVTLTVTDVNGNMATKTATVNVQDKMAPTVETRNITVQLNASGTVSILASQIDSASTDNCGIASMTVSPSTFNCTKLGDNTVTLTVKDAKGNTGTRTAIVTVQDLIAPTAVAKNISVTLTSSGTANITPAQVNNGSSDNCGIAAMFLDRTSFNCSDIGTHTVILTVSDATGNTATSTANVTVIGEIPSGTVSSMPSNSVYTGGISTNLYLGYGPQSTSLKVTAPASGAPYTYSWTGNGTLNSYTSPAPVFAPGAAGTYTFTVTYKNRFGCTTTGTISICVTDIRVAGGGKVYVCSQTVGTVAVNTSAVAAYLSANAGSRLGTCEQQPCSSPVIMSSAPKISGQAVTEETVSGGDAFTVTVMPNPSRSYFTIKLQSRLQTAIDIRVADAAGRIIESKQKLGANSTVTMGHAYTSGVYYAEIIQGNRRKVIQLIKAK
jgi:hypothetical protein